MVDLSVVDDGCHSHGYHGKFYMELDANMWLITIVSCRYMMINRTMVTMILGHYGSRWSVMAATVNSHGSSWFINRLLAMVDNGQ